MDIAAEVARVGGLDVAGIDFVCPDISQPVRGTGGGICEVNAAPGFRMHSLPTIGEPQYLAKPLTDLMFSPGTRSRIPIVGILREGLGCIRNDVAVVLTVPPDQLGLRGINSVEQLAKVKQVIAEAVPKSGAAVLNADDKLVAGMHQACSGEIGLVHREAEHRMVSDHCGRGGKALSNV